MSTQKLGNSSAESEPPEFPVCYYLLEFGFLLKDVLVHIYFGKGMSQVKQGWDSDLKSEPVPVMEGIIPDCPVLISPIPSLLPSPGNQL